VKSVRQPNLIRAVRRNYAWRTNRTAYWSLISSVTRQTRDRKYPFVNVVVWFLNGRERFGEGREEADDLWPRFLRVSRRDDIGTRTRENDRQHRFDQREIRTERRTKREGQ